MRSAELLERLVRRFWILARDALAAAHLLDPLEQRVARDDVQREQEVLHGDVVVAEVAHLLLGLVEHARERGRDGGLLSGALDRRPRRKLLLGVGAQLGSVRNELLRQLLVEEREQQVLGVDLWVAGAPGALL